MIRIATPEEVESFCHLAENFYQTRTPYSKCRSKFDPAVFSATWRMLLEASLGIVLLRIGSADPAEAMGAVINADPNDGVLSATTAFWYFVEEPSGLAGGLLYVALEEALRERGVKRLYAGVGLTERFPKVMNFMLAQGYRPFEVSMAKDL